MLQKWMEITPDATWSVLQMAIDCLSDSSHNGMELNCKCMELQMYVYMHIHT